MRWEQYEHKEHERLKIKTMSTRNMGKKPSAQGTLEAKTMSTRNM
jgi:hypothetical protein